MAILGASGQAEDIHDGTLCRQKSPCPGPAGRDSAGASPAAALNKVNSIRWSQEAIRRRMRQLENQLKYLDEKHVPDSHPWITFGILGREDQIPMTGRRQLMSGYLPGMENSEFPSLRAALQHDVQVLRGYLRQFEREAAQARRVALRRAALDSSASFDHQLLHLLRDAEKSGELDSQQLESLRGASDRALRRWQKIVERDPSPENMKGLLSQLAHSMQVGLDEGSGAARDAWASLGNSASKVTRAAEQRFRANPSVESFRRYFEKAAASLQLGGEGIAEMPSYVPRLRPEKTYLVKPGDTLAGISKLFYGGPGYWDFIYMQNLKEIGESPEQLSPNIVLQIP